MTTFTRSAALQWDGELVTGKGKVVAGSGAFDVDVRFPSVAGDPPDTTTPEELLAASHAACYGVGLRSLIGRKGGRAHRVTVTAAISAEKSADGVSIRSSHLTGIIEGLENLDNEQLQEVAREVAEECTISAAIRGAVLITHEVKAEDQL